MVNTNLLILTIYIILVSQSCTKDMELSLQKSPHDKEKLNIDGYYHMSHQGENSGIISVFFLYENGVMLNAGGHRTNDLNELDIHVRNNYLTFNYSETKYTWGVFKVENSKINIEQWRPSSGGPLKTEIWEGEIIDTSTFIIRNQFSNYTNESYSVADTFRLRSFTPKPDSTNTFIK